MNHSTTFDQTGLEIAIIGMAGRFPGAKNIDEFWQNLQDGVEAISFFSDQELATLNVNPALLQDPNYVRARGVLADVESFDASLFDFNPREAEITDPQQRLFLECAWEALENAGYDPETYAGLIGVYAGVSANTYLLNNLILNRDLVQSVDAYQLTIANDKDHLTTRVSYKLNLEGPSVTVQTACSTSLVAVHLACQGLLSGGCDIALAGGISIFVPQKTGYIYQEGGIVSRDGHCRAFDAQAQGTVWGNGVGIVVLKRLADALADRDCIHAVIKGSAINNDGGLKVGYTAPRVDGQAKVIKTAQMMAGVEPDTITYIEAHGTGTSLGDPIEIAALTQAFDGARQKGYCAIGSVKTNVGHLIAAAGVAGLIKTVLALKYKLIPPSLHFEQPNPKIDFASSPFYVNTKLTEWKTNGMPRRAGVSSFGIGGTNAHAVLEEVPAIEPSGESRPWYLVLISASSSSALEAAATNLVEHLKQHPDLNLADVAYTLQMGRKALSHRRMLVCRDREDATIALETRDAKRLLTAFQEPEHRPLAFMFPGQGAQYVNMAVGLYQVEPTFREQVDHCCQLLQPLLGLDLRSVLYPEPAHSEQAARQLEQTQITQPALFVIEYALAQLWMAWGVHPEAMIGHSIGEYVAACLAGVFSLEDALALVACRGQLMQALPGGAMLSVPLSEEELRPLLDEQLAVAAINAPSLCVVSGPTDAVAALERQLTAKGQTCRRLHTSHAFHSRMMEPVMDPFLARVKQATLKPPQIPFVSNVTGTWITEAQATDPAYWTGHLRQAVRFADGIGELLNEPARILLEIGPGRTLSTLVKQHANSSGDRVVLSSVRHPQDQQPDVAFSLNALGRLWLAGVRIDWSGFYAHERRCRLPLPTYPFERQRYWIEPPGQANDGYWGIPTWEPDRKRPDVANWFYVPSWKPTLLPVPSKQRTQPDRWLVFSDVCRMGDQVVKRLEQMGQTVINVRAGQHFARLSEREFTINPRQRDDYFSLLSELGGLDQPSKIVHLWGVTHDDKTLSRGELFQNAQYAGFYSLLFLAQALGQNLQSALQIWIVTNNMQAVAGEAFLCPEKATVLGPAQVVPQEYPYITCHSVDIVLPEWGTWQAEKLIDQLIAEAQSDSAEPVVAYRDHQRLAQTFETIRLDSEAGSASPLRENGVYLITAGSESPGFALAEAIAQTVRANLILVEDASLPAREQWEQWLATHDGQDGVSRKIRNVQTLERMAAKALVIQADVGDQEQMQAVMARIDEQFGKLHGVIYAARIAGEDSPDTAQDVRQSEYLQHVQSTASDLSVLEQVLQGQLLDFCLLPSSLSAILGRSGTVADVAAHLFTGAFVHQHNRRHPVPWMSVHWDAWQFEADKTPTTIGAHLAELTMTPQEGAQAFQYILSRGTIAQIAISTSDLQSQLNQWGRPNAAYDSQLTSGPVARHSRPNLPTAYVAPGNEIEQTVAIVWQELLGVEPIGLHDNFFELGGHSLLATQLMSRLRHTFRVEVPLSSLYEEPTVANLASTIAQNRERETDNQIGVFRSEQDQAIQTLENLVALSDEQVDALLKDLLSAQRDDQ